jgi:hypothetical protein
LDYGGISFSVCARDAAFNAPQTPRKMKVKPDFFIKCLKIVYPEPDYSGTPPFANAEWKDDKTMCQWCAGTGHPYGEQDGEWAMCKCPDIEK